MDYALTDKIAIVTGGSTGIGCAVAQALAVAGAAVVVNYRVSQHEADATVDSIRQAGGRAVAVQADVTHAADVDELLRATLAHFGAVHILVNNAGGNARRCTLAETDEALWDEMMSLNLKSSFLCCRAFAPRLPDSYGRIINISSISAYTGGGNAGIAYASAKAGMIAMTRGLATELAPRGITVNAVAPGVIETRYHQLKTPPDMLQQLKDRIPLKRLGTPGDVAAITAVLASDASSYITGQVIHINGGLLMA